MPLRSTPEDEALWASMVQWTALVLVPGALFVFGLIYFVSPRHAPPSQAWANGTYVNPCCPSLILRDGTLTTNGKATRYRVSGGKFGYQIDVAEGIVVRRGRVTFGSSIVFVYFNRDSVAVPALGKAESLHLVGWDDSRDYVFTKVN